MARGGDIDVRRVYGGICDRNGMQLFLDQFLYIQNASELEKCRGILVGTTVELCHSIIVSKYVGAIAHGRRVGWNNGNNVGWGN